MAVIDNAIANGYTMAWGADVSEVGFTRKGIGVMPDADNGADLTGSDMAKWVGMSKDKLTDNGFHRLPSWQDALRRYLAELKENDNG